MRRSMIALLAVTGSALAALSVVGAYVIGVGVGVDERRAKSGPSLPQEQVDKVPDNLTRRGFQSWSLVCKGPEQSVGRCVLFIGVMDVSRKNVLLTFSIAQGEKGAPLLVIDTPSDVSVQDGVTVTTGRAQSLKVGIQSCSPQRCRAMVPLDLSLQEALASSDTTSVSYVRANNERANYDLPTRGFREGFTAWAANNAATQQPTAVN